MEKKPSKKLKRFGIAALILLVLIALVFFQINRARQDRLATTKTFTIETGEISLVSIATGKLTSSDEDKIKLSGTVSSLFVQLGDQVTQGQELGEYTKTGLEALALYAPVGGIVTQLPSGLASEFIISNPSALAMSFSVAEADINRFKLWQSAEVYVGAIDTTFYGSVSEIRTYSASVTPATSYTVTVNFDKGDKPALIGMSGVVKTFVEGYGDYYANGKLSSSDQRSIKADGTITSVDVKLGDTVKARQKLGEYQPGSAKTKIIATRDGVVSALPTTVNPELVISNPNALQLVVNIAETDIHKIVAGQEAKVTVEAVDQRFTGTVTRISQIGNTALDYTTYPVTIRFDSPDTPLFIGMSGSAEIVVETKSNILVVPFEALVSEGTKRYLLSADWLKHPNQPQSDFYIPVETGFADVYNVEVIGDNLLGKEIILIEPTTGLSTLFGRANQ